MYFAHRLLDNVAALVLLQQPAMRPGKLEHLQQEVRHVQATFEKLKEGKTLYANGLHPVCRYDVC